MSAALQAPPRGAGRSAADNDAVEDARAALADWLQVASGRIVFAGSATLALNIAIYGLPGESFRHAVATVMEHNSVLRPLYRAVARWGGRLSIVGLDEEGRLDRQAWLRALEEEPTLAALNHVSNVSGQINPAEELLARARAAGAVTLLDASQSAGHLELTRLASSVDLLVFGGQKGLHGPPGVGLLYVAPRLELEPLYSGGTGVHSELPTQPPAMPVRLEAGTLNAPAIEALAAAVRWHRRAGAAFVERSRQMAERLEQGLHELPHVRLYGVAGPRLGVVAFRLDGWHPEETAAVLQQSFGVICRAGLHCAPLMHRALGTADAGTVRFSVSGFTAEEEVDRALEAVRLMAA
jgi:selenocysteine lyase/cysteine desulfurase